MKLILIFALSTLVFFSCDKSATTAPESNMSLKGNYAGTFHRTGMDTITIGIEFSGDNFSGNSSRPKYPAICRGSFALDHSNSTITFSDSCAWTADFDWTLILDGKYNISFLDQGQVKMVRNNGLTTDEYLLYRPVR